MPSQKNTEYLQKTKELLKSGKAFYFTDFSSLSVLKLEALRRELKKSSGEYLVVKNTLGFLAMKDLGFDEDAIKKLFIGPTGIAIAYDDPIVLAKVLKAAEDLKIKGGIIEGTYFDTEGFLRYSQIPSKNVLYSNLVSSLNIIGNFVDALEGILKNLIYTIEAIGYKEVK